MVSAVALDGSMEQTECNRSDNRYHGLTHENLVVDFEVLLLIELRL